MSQHNFGWPTVIAGWIVSGSEWFFGSMSGLSILVTAATLILTILKILESIRELRKR